MEEPQIVSETQATDDSRLSQSTTQTARQSVVPHLVEGRDSSESVKNVPLKSNNETQAPGGSVASEQARQRTHSEINQETAASNVDKTEHKRVSNMSLVNDEQSVKMMPIKNNPVYNITLVADKLNEYPVLKIRQEGKYYLSMKNVVVEKHPRVKRNKRGQVIPTMHKEVLGPIESIFSRFCEDVLCISRATTLPLSSQGERHLIWVGRIKAKHIIKFLKGNGCYIVNRFPGDVFLKDKQVMGVTLRQFMLERKNSCFWKCGAPKDHYVDEEDEEDIADDITYRICQHMVQSMRTSTDGCTDENCYNFEKRVCKHFDIFIPEVQSFCLYNALQDFSNRLDDDLKGQLFICKPSYLYKGLGFRFFHRGAEFQEFYHMTIGKETSRHDFMVQRVVKDPYLFKGRKVDIRAFLLIITLRHRRVVAFVNPGFCRISSVEYTPFNVHSEDEEPQEGLSAKQKRERRDEELAHKMRMLVCPHQTDAERAERAKRMAENRLFTDEEDRSKELDEVFRSESLLARVKRQIKHIGNRLASAIEKKIWDAYGCYQIFGMDLCVDETYKVWLLEVNSHAMSEVDMLSPTQRIMVPAVMMEALGLVVECMYKSTHGHRLRKSPHDEFKTTGFLFGQNFEMAFSTLAKRRTNYVHPRPPKDNGPPFYQRITMVDNMIQRTARRKKACEDLKNRLHNEKITLKQRRSEKDEEES